MVFMPFSAYQDSYAKKQQIVSHLNVPAKTRRCGWRPDERIEPCSSEKSDFEHQA